MDGGVGKESCVRIKRRRDWPLTARDCEPDSAPTHGLSAACALDPEVVQPTEPTHIRDIIGFDIEPDDLTKLKEELGSNGHDVPLWELYTSVDPEG